MLPWLPSELTPPVSQQASDPANRPSDEQGRHRLLTDGLAVFDMPAWAVGVLRTRKIPAGSGRHEEGSSRDRVAATWPTVLGDTRRRHRGF